MGVPLGAGELRETIQIQTRSETRTGTGGVTGSWSTDYTRRAKVEPVRGNERAQLATADAIADVRVWIRKPGVTVTAQDRLVWNSRDFDIESVHEVQAGEEWLEIMAREHQA